MSEPLPPEAQAEIIAATSEVDYVARLRTLAKDTELRTMSSVLFNRWQFANMAGITFGGHRDLYQILGYKRILTYLDYRDRYARDGIAQAIVDAYPAATWRGGVELYEDEDPNKDTEFEKAFKELDQRLGFWQRLQQVDTLAGLSTFAVLLIGNGDADLTTELTKGGEVKFLRPFSGGGGPIGINRGWGNRSSAFDAAVSVAEWDTDPTSERYGEPKFYDIRAVGANNPNMVGRRVHWSRMLHVAEGCLEDDVYGVPVLEAVWNLLDDLAKVTGGGAEAHWLRANQGLHLNVDKDMGLPSTTPGKPAVPGLSADDRKELREKAEEMSHQLQRVLVTRGVEVNQLGSDVASFGQNADAILKQIAGAKKIPMRILTGSEMGTLASEQDAANFDSRVQDRRTGYAGPRIVRKLVDRLIEYGYLPTPKQYEVGWPVEENMDEMGKAAFALNLANVNKTAGITVFTDDEIRDMAFDKPPLTPEQKVPVAAPVREQAQATDNPDAALKQPKPAQVPEVTAAEMRALEAAIEANDVDAVARLVGLQHSYATTQVQLPESFARYADTIVDSDLAPKGRVTDPHVTLRYGLLSDDPEPVRALLAGKGPITLTLGRFGVFETPDGDALYVEVRSDDLVRLNALVSARLPVVETHDYVPHATVAYLKPGLGAQYASLMSPFAGQQHVMSSVDFISSDDERTTLSVSGC